jgi:repressor LexA
MQTLGAQLRRKRLRLGLTLDELAARTGISKPYLSLIETGRVTNPPSDQKLTRLEEALGFAPGELLAQAHLQRTPRDVRAVLQSLLGGRVRPDARGQDQGAEHAGINLDDAYVSGMLRELVEKSAGNVERISTGSVPVINRVAAGYPTDFTDLEYPPRVADAYVGCPDLQDPHAFAARVWGDSMAPKYVEGDIVIFSPAAPTRSGDDCFVRFADGHTTFKRVFFEPAEGGAELIRLQPRNERYRPQVVEAAAITGLYRAVYRYQRLEQD